MILGYKFNLMELCFYQNIDLNLVTIFKTAVKESK